MCVWVGGVGEIFGGQRSRGHVVMGRVMGQWKRGVGVHISPHSGSNWREKRFGCKLRGWRRLKV